MNLKRESARVDILGESQKITAINESGNPLRERNKRKERGKMSEGLLRLETVARGLGFIRIADSGNEVIRWERVEKYLAQLGIPTCGHDDFIPEKGYFSTTGTGFAQLENTGTEKFCR